MHPGSLIWTNDERESRAEKLGGEGRTFSSRARQKRDTLRRRHFKPSVLIWEGWFPPILTFKFCYAILLCCYLCSFVRNSYMHVRILLFPFEFCYLLFWFYYAIMHSFIQFRILLFAFELCYAVVQFYDSIVQSSHAVSNPIISFPILLFTFPILFLFFSFQFYYSLSNYVLPNPGLA